MEIDQPLPPAGPAESRWGRVARILSLVAVALSLLVLTFVWPSARSEAEGLSIAVTGDADLVGAFLTGAEGGRGEVVDLVQVDDREEALDGIRKRKFIGGFVLGQGSAEVLTAPANGQVPTAFMTEFAFRLQTTLDAQAYAGVRSGIEGAVSGGTDPSSALDQIPESLLTVTVTDVVPYSEGDPNGVGATAAGVPLTVGALLAGIVIAFTVAGPWRRLAAVLGLGVGGGLLLTVILETWLQVYPGSFGIVWLALGLSLTATSGLFVGLHSALGRVGLGVAGVVTLFAAMPWAAFAIPYEFLPAGLGYIGQWLIPGATATLTRTVSYFPDAGARGPWWVLSTWALIGLAVLFVRKRAHPR